MYLKKKCAYVLLIAVLLISGGCGYTMHGTLPEGVSTIAVPTFKNAVPQSDRYTYESGLEIDLTNSVLDRILYDGNLRVAPVDKADAVLLGQIVRYEQESVRYNSTEGVKQYRLFLVVELTFKNQKTGEIIWQEKNFSGDTEYFIEGTTAVSERVAADNAIDDLAKKIVDRIVEDW